jgi:hypothetical protein
VARGHGDAAVAHLQNQVDRRQLLAQRALGARDVARVPLNQADCLRVRVGGGRRGRRRQASASGLR